MPVKTFLRHRLAKPLVLAVSLLPSAWLLFAAIANQLGANPAQALSRATGDWTLRFLCIVLTITPLRVSTSTPELARFRRMLGLFAYFYAVLHFLSYGWFDMGFELGAMAQDVTKRPFILVGLLALALLTALALTSFRNAIKVLGAKRWQLLHRLIYLAAGLAVLHFFWMRAGKNDFSQVLVYAGILAICLLWRCFNWISKNRL
jgi:sulfoxide reductase heme-binding subunit YedZ